MKKVILFVMVCLLVLPTGFLPTSAEASKLSYEVSLRNKEGVDNNLFWTPHSTYSLENLNDGDPSTINQVEYHGTTGEDMYEDNLLKDSFYIILDLNS